jgi:hypothetical protein
MDTHELAWAAGFYDGEGCTYSSRLNPTSWPCVTLNVNQIEPTTLRRMAAALGCGFVSGPHARKQAHHRPIYQYRISNFEQAQAAVAKMWKWLGQPKREQAAKHLRLVAEWEANRATSLTTKARSARSRKVTGERCCMKAGHPKSYKGRCIECQKARQASEEYKAWTREYQRKRRAKAALEGA